MPDKNSPSILAKQVDLLYRHLPFALLLTVAMLLLFLGFLGDFPNPAALRMWVVLMIIVVLFRTYTLILYKKTKERNSFQVKRAETLFTAGVIFAGLGWGCLGWWLYPIAEDNSIQMLIFGVLMGVAGLAMTSLSYRLFPSCAFIILTLLPMFIGLYCTPASQTVVIAVILGVYLFSLLGSVYIFYKNYEQVLILQIKAQDRGEELKVASGKAESANRTKSEFLANMSHELRTPLNAIIGFVDLSLQEEIPNKVRKNLDIVKMSSSSLLQLMKDILDLSRVDAGKLVLEAIDFSLHNILYNLEAMVRREAEEKGNSFTLNIMDDVPDALIGDPLRLGQILVNIVNNGIKFTRNGELLVDVSCQSSSPEMVSLKFLVRDTGIGIAKEKLDDIFKTFTQADTSTTREFGGTGLGLAISRELTQLLGGELEVSSTLGVGSTFSFALSFRRQIEDEPLAKAVDLHGIKVLIVDDDAMVLGLLRDILVQVGVEVEIVAQSTVVKEKLRNAANQNIPFDLVLLDLMMPGQDGLTTAREIRNDPLVAQTPIVILTGHGSGLEQQRAREVSINAFLHKPISRDMLIENIRVVLDKKEVCNDDIVIEPKKDSSGLLMDHKILLVEDDLFNQMLAREVLKKEGLQVETALNGLEALELLDSTFDAILMDVQMPTLDGLTTTVFIRRCESGDHLDAGEHQELLTKLSAKIYGRHIPIVAMTANAMEGDREKCLEAGMDDYVTKPFDKKDVLQSLAQFIDHKVQ